MRQAEKFKFYYLYRRKSAYYLAYFLFQQGMIDICSPPHLLVMKEKTIAKAHGFPPVYT